ncbi:MAG: hypothetical protein U0797_25350 [Gemmataceae bacterium]
MKNLLFASAAALALLAGHAAAGGYDCGPKSCSGGFGLGLGIGISVSGSAWKGCAAPPCCPPGGCAPGYNLGAPYGPGGHDLAAMQRGHGHPGFQAVAYQNPGLMGTFPALAAGPSYGYGYNGYNPGAVAYNYGYSPYAAQPNYGAHPSAYAWGQAPANYPSPYAAPVYPVSLMGGR